MLNTELTDALRNSVELLENSFNFLPDKYIKNEFYSAQLVKGLLNHNLQLSTQEWNDLRTLLHIDKDVDLVSYYKEIELKYSLNDVKAKNAAFKI